MTPAELKSIRQRLGLTQRGLAEAAGCSRGQIQDLEAGHRTNGTPAPIGLMFRLALAALELGLRDHPAEPGAWQPRPQRTGTVAPGVPGKD